MPTELTLEQPVHTHSETRLMSEEQTEHVSCPYIFRSASRLLRLLLQYTYNS